MKISDEESGNANLAHLAAQMGNAAMLQVLAERGGGFLSFPRVRGAAFPRSVAQLRSPWTVIPSDLDHCSLRNGECDPMALPPLVAVSVQRKILNGLTSYSGSLWVNDADGDVDMSVDGKAFGFPRIPNGSSSPWHSPQYQKHVAEVG